MQTLRWSDTCMHHITSCFRCTHKKQASHITHTHRHTFDSTDTHTFCIAHAFSHTHLIYTANTHTHKLTGHKSLNVVKVEQIRAVLFALFTGNNGGGSKSCQAKELVHTYVCVCLHVCICKCVCVCDCVHACVCARESL